MCDCLNRIIAANYWRLAKCIPARRSQMSRFPRRWLQLPDVGVWPQLPVLQSFQQIVELQESSRLLVDLGLGGRPDHPYGDLKVDSLVPHPLGKCFPRH